jgi:hypothetical protein
MNESRLRPSPGEQPEEAYRFPRWKVALTYRTGAGPIEEVVVSRVVV